MNIAMMSAWNSDSGVSIHAELIGREWVRMGHRLHVFSFFTSDFHGTAMVGEDEDYVVRCFTTSGAAHPYLDPRPFLSTDYEVFVAQDLGMLPKDSLAKIFHHIRRKATTVTVIHDSGPSSDPSFYQFDWDGIVCFDHRYWSFLHPYHPADRIYTIPFPCHPLRRGDQREARARLGLPQEKKILFIFGQRIKEHLPLFPVVREMARDLPILLLIVSKKDIEELQGIDGMEVEIRQDAPSLELLYQYLHASDVLILHRQPCEGAVVSSAAFQCLGSGCPILASDSPFFETLKEVVITYSNFEEFKTHLIDVLNRGERYQTSQRALTEFIRRHSAEAVAKEYIDLFHAIQEERTRSVWQRATSVFGVMTSFASEAHREKDASSSVATLGESGKRRLQAQ